MGKYIILCLPLIHTRLQRFHTVLSDMCPATSGNATLDALQSLELQRTALQIALGASFDPDISSGGSDSGSGGGQMTGVLLPQGSIVMKLLEGSGSRELGEVSKATNIPPIDNLHVTGEALSLLCWHTGTYW